MQPHPIRRIQCNQLERQRECNPRLAAGLHSLCLLTVIFHAKLETRFRRSLWYTFLTMDFTRKGFLGTLAAVGLTGASRPSPADRAAVRPSGPPRLRFGVLSDIHVTDAAATAPFEAVLRELDDWGADGVMVCGDLSDYGVVPQLEEIGKAWFRAFPGGFRAAPGEAHPEVLEFLEAHGGYIAPRGGVMQALQHWRKNIIHA